MKGVRLASPGLLALLLWTNLVAPAAAQEEIDPADAAVQKIVAVLESWARERAVVDAVRQQNARVTSLEVIQALDARWVSGEAEAEIQELAGNACSRRLEVLLGAASGYHEALVMDDQGALVCTNGRPSDYWQGDEAKWQRSFADGAGAVFVDRPRYDTSARAILVQISVPVRQGERTIGVLTVGVDRAKLEP